MLTSWFFIYYSLSEGSRKTCKCVLLYECIFMCYLFSNFWSLLQIIFILQFSWWSSTHLLAYTYFIYFCLHNNLIWTDVMNVGKIEINFRLKVFCVGYLLNDLLASINIESVVLIILLNISLSNVIKTNRWTPT